MIVPAAIPQTTPAPVADKGHTRGESHVGGARANERATQKHFFAVRPSVCGAARVQSAWVNLEVVVVRVGVDLLDDVELKIDVQAKERVV
jgi:hypothetical protein